MERGDEAAQERPPARPLTRVLVVEDEREARELAGFILDDLGFDPHLVMDGYEAYRVADAFQIILMDLSMPGVDGYATAQRILKKNPKCYIVALTAHCSAEHEKHARLIGMREFLRKPISYTTLREVMWRALQEVQRGE